MANRAKGCNGRGGNAHGKEYEARRHGAGGGKGKRRRASASRVEKAHETVERRAGKAEIAAGVAEWDGSTELAQLLAQPIDMDRAFAEAAKKLGIAWDNNFYGADFDKCATGNWKNLPTLKDAIDQTRAMIKAEECDQCDRAKCEANPCYGCGETYRDCDGSCNNGCGEVS